MSHDMRPRVPGRMVGRAVTAILRQLRRTRRHPALSAKHSVAMIDNSKPGEVGIIVVENGLDVAGWAGSWQRPRRFAAWREFLIDGGLRDVAEVRALELAGVLDVGGAFQFGGSMGEC